MIREEKRKGNGQSMGTVRVRPRTDAKRDPIVAENTFLKAYDGRCSAWILCRGYDAEDCLLRF